MPITSSQDEQTHLSIAERLYRRQSSYGKWGTNCDIDKVLNELITNPRQIRAAGHYILKSCTIADLEQHVAMVMSAYKEYRIIGDVILHTPVLRNKHWTLMEVRVGRNIHDEITRKNVEYDSHGANSKPDRIDENDRHVIKRNEQNNSWSCMDHTIQQALRNVNKTIQIFNPRLKEYEDAIDLGYRSGSGEGDRQLRESIENIINARNNGWRIKFRNLSQEENRWYKDFELARAGHDTSSTHRKPIYRRSNHSQESLNYTFEKDTSFIGYTARALMFIGNIILKIILLPFTIVNCLIKLMTCCIKSIKAAITGKPIVSQDKIKPSVSKLPDSPVKYGAVQKPMTPLKNRSELLSRDAALAGPLSGPLAGRDSSILSSRPRNTRIN